MKKNIVSLMLMTVLIVIAFSSNAQTGKTYTISGEITGQKKGLEAANVILLNEKDSAVVKMVITNKTGQYSMENVSTGSYIIKTIAIGYETYFSNSFRLSASQKLDFHLKPLTQDLAAVTVTSKKPLIEQKLDKTIINVDASPSNTGLTAMDVLEKSPGVLVDKDGNISLKGKPGVLVLIDGKPSYLSATDLANMLKSMSSSTIDQIELMTNPPAKYDAAGNSGIINIKTKKTKTVGYNGSVTVGYGQGVYPKSNNSINLNYRKDKVNLFGNFSYNYYGGFQDLGITRNFRTSNGEDILSIFKQKAFMKRQQNNVSYKVGADYYASKKTTLGVVVNGFSNPSTENNNNVTDILNSNSVLQSTTLASSKIKNNLNNMAVNFNGRHVFDSTGKELSMDLDYVHYNTLNNQMFVNSFYDNSGNKIMPDQWLKGNLPSDINIYSAKADYSQKLKHNIKMEAGFKVSYVKTDNVSSYFNQLGNQWVMDSTQSNHFIYEENINAAYVSFSKQLSKKWSLQLGSRVENTHSKGTQLFNGVSFDRNYTQLFPTFYLGYKPNDNNQFSLNYGKRIQRPDYEDLNPFYYFLDKYTYMVGNPYLLPQISQNIEVNHIYKGFLTTSLSYGVIDNFITQVFNQVDSIHTTYVKNDNIARVQNYTLSLNAAFSPAKFWKINWYNQFNINNFNGYVNEGPISVSGFNYTTNFSSTFEVKKGLNVELNGFYRTVTQEGTITANEMSQLNLAISKQILKDKGTIRLNCRDFLKLQHFSGYSRFQNIDVQLYNTWDTRVFNLSFTYRFAKGKAGAAPRKSAGAIDEANRVKSNN
jgi:iron complex outermembrane receptor protein